VKALVEVTEPPLVCTVIVPVDAVTGKAAVMLVDETTVTEELAAPLKLTVAGATKFVPVIVTVAPSLPEVGAKTLIAGAAANALAPQSETSAKIARWKGRFLWFIE
jgi:hypothetical protein